MGLSGDFDLIFIDANKAEYHSYVKVILEKELLSDSGIIVADNILYNGYPYVHQHFDAQPARRQFGQAIKDFNEWVKNNPALEQVLLPVRDGISLIRKRSTKSSASTREKRNNVEIQEKPTSAEYDALKADYEKLKEEYEALKASQKVSK